MAVSPRRAPARGTRAQLLDEAARLFATRGYLGVSIDDIGASVGISGPAIYRHFRGKDALLGEILVAISESLLAGGRERRDTAASPAAALDSLVAFHTDFALDHPELITVQDRDLHNLRPEDRRRVRHLQREYVEIWVDQLRAITPGLDVETARAATHATFGLLNSTPHLPASTTVDRSAVAALLRRMVLAALADLGVAAAR